MTSLLSYNKEWRINMKISLLLITLSIFLFKSKLLAQSSAIRIAYYHKGEYLDSSFIIHAKKNNYNGVTCVVNSSRPAFKFYRKEGWIVDKAFYIGNYHFCWMRHVV